MEQKNHAIAIVQESDLSKVEFNLLNASQLKLLLAKTPKKYVHKRPAKGGGTWDYVTGGYIKKVLNLMFGWDWDFKVVNSTIQLEAGQVIIHGELTVRIDKGDRIATVVKHQFGRADVKFKKSDKTPVDLGNDMKAATTDALKKCAAELGIAADIYNKLDFQELQVVDDLTKEMLMNLFIEVQDKLSETDQINIERIIKEQEESSYQKAYNHLVKYKK